MVRVRPQVASQRGQIRKAVRCMDPPGAARRAGAPSIPTGRDGGEGVADARSAAKGRPAGEGSVPGRGQSRTRAR
ncbi:hypothetical protein GCM10010302_71730 [Streptomyces polychromogenes]|uniref:Uncharacterized protein n=1 Tax=Streptomyces polychromogenes TaxID=67342 RepID=A0ABP3FRL3_9ACTN